MMNLSHDYVLVLDEQRRHLHQADLPLISERYALVVAASEQHAVEQARQAAPCLVILVGDSHTWFKSQVDALRHSTDTPPMTIVALTESTAPTWQLEKDTLEVDGFLVKPVTDEILNSLVQSAIIKQSYR